MEALFFIGITAAAIFAYNSGIKEGQSRTLRWIEQATHSGMNPQSAFAQTYGRPGFYFDDLHSDLNAGPLAVTSSANFLRLVARERLGKEASSEELNTAIEKMADAYHLANGWSPEKLAAIKKVSNQLHHNENDA